MAKKTKKKTRVPQKMKKAAYFQGKKKEEIKEGPVMIQNRFEVVYRQSYAQDSPFFHGLFNNKLMGTMCRPCRFRYATPRAQCMHCGRKTDWFELPLEGKIHTFTTCFFGSESFLDETPYTLALIEFPGIQTLFMSRIAGVGQQKLEIGMKVKARFKRKKEGRVSDVYFIPMR